MARKIFLSILLFVAGIIHLYSPGHFINAVPDFLIFKKQIIYVTGLIELILSLGFLNQKVQHICARITAYYFLFLVPVHAYVAFNGIEMFGINSKPLLWLRLILQYPLILCAHSLTNNPWIIEQVWRHVLFIHYKVDPSTIEHLVPFKLDLFEGKAIVSIVPFYMDRIRFPFLPAVPKLSSLWELNLRTYVDVNGVKGVYFFTLETDSRIGEIIANKIFFLPYRFCKINAGVSGNEYRFNHARENINFEMTAQLTSHKDMKNFFDIWATERYSLFTKHENIIYRGDVMHEPWIFFDVIVKLNRNSFFKVIEQEGFNPEKYHYSDKLKVRFKPFQKLNPAK